MRTDHRLVAVGVGLCAVINACSEPPRRDEELARVAQRDGLDEAGVGDDAATDASNASDAAEDANASDAAADASDAAADASDAAADASDAGDAAVGSSCQSDCSAVGGARQAISCSGANPNAYCKCTSNGVGDTAYCTTPGVGYSNGQASAVVDCAGTGATTGISCAVGQTASCVCSQSGKGSCGCL